MSKLNCYLTTFNCGRTPVNTSSLSGNLFDALPTSSNLPPDLIVLCLQEIAPLAQSFLGGSFLRPYYSQFSKTVQDAASSRFGSDAPEYVSLFARNVGMTALLVFATPELRERIRWMETAGVGVGVQEMGNKGAVGARLGLDDDGQEEEAVVTFVAAHLAPMEEECEKRNRDWKSICERLVFVREEEPRKNKVGVPESEPLLVSGEVESNGRTSGLFSVPSHIFFAGDLNYRTSDMKPHPDDHKSWPHPNNGPKTSEPMAKMFEQDQLTRELHDKKTLHLLAEAPITFPPTYKYSDAAQQQALKGPASKSDTDAKDTSPWAKHRVPSWCDRILYLASAPPTVHGYTALPIQPTSDHRPVAMSVSVQLDRMPSQESMKPPFTLDNDWKQCRAAARRMELLVGLAAYLALTWEGRALLAGTVVGILGGYVVLSSMLAS